MPLWTPTVSRFLAAIRPVPSSSSPERTSHGSGSEYESHCVDPTRSDEVIEILDSGEQSDWEATATNPEEANSTRVSREIPAELTQSVRNSSRSDFSDASDGRSVISWTLSQFGLIKRSMKVQVLPYLQCLISVLPSGHGKINCLNLKHRFGMEMVSSWPW